MIISGLLSYLCGRRALTRGSLLGCVPDDHTEFRSRRASGGCFSSGSTPLTFLDVGSGAHTTTAGGIRQGRDFPRLVEHPRVTLQIHSLVWHSEFLLKLRAPSKESNRPSILLILVVECFTPSRSVTAVRVASWRLGTRPATHEGGALAREVVGHEF